jgi:hypothetical protein
MNDYPTLPVSVLEADKCPANFTRVYVGGKKRICPFGTWNSQLFARLDKFS